MVVLFYGLCSKCQIQSYKLTSRRLQCNTTTIFIAGNLPNRLWRNVPTVLISLLLYGHSRKFNDDQIRLNRANMWVWPAHAHVWAPRDAHLYCTRAISAPAHYWVTTAHAPCVTSISDVLLLIVRKDCIPNLAPSTVFVLSNLSLIQSVYTLMWTAQFTIFCTTFLLFLVFG